jgi:hypothetical protein
MESNEVSSWAGNLYIDRVIFSDTNNKYECWWEIRNGKKYKLCTITKDIFLPEGFFDWTGRTTTIDKEPELLIESLKKIL